MAESKICPNCGAQNPASNRFCEDCGYDMNKAPASGSVPVSAAFCPNGHIVNETGLALGFCDVCGEKLVSQMPDIQPVETYFDSEMVRPLPPTHEDPIVISPYPPSKDPLPDIPDIMRPLTNSDMKR